MAGLHIVDFVARLQRLTNRLQEAEAFIAEKKHVTEPECIEMLLQHLANNIKRVREALPNFEQTEPSDEDSRSACETLLQADDVLLELNVHLRNYWKSTSPQQMQIQQPQQVSHPAKQLEISIKAFDGTRSKYHAFKTAIEVISNRKTASYAEKLLFLQQHLGAKPAKLLENIPISEQGYKLAWELLDEEYSDAARIKNDIFNQLTKMPPATDDPNSLKDTLDNIEALLRILETYQEVGDEVNNNETYRRIILAKFPRSIIRHITPLGQTPKLKDIRANLRTIIRTEIDVTALVEPIQSISMIGNTASPNISTATPLLTASGDLQHKNNSFKKFERTNNAKNGNRRTNQSETSSPTCAFCFKPHYSSECKNYETSEARKNALPPNACIICLRVGHSRQRCLSKNHCYYCKNRSHHSAFCPTKFGYFARPENKSKHQTEVDTKKPDLTEPKKNIEEPKPEIKSASIALVRSHQSAHLTARVQIRNPTSGKTSCARALFDCAAPETFLLEDTSAQLNLSSHDKNAIRIFTFGNKEYRDLHSDTVNFDLLIPGQRPINIFADTTPFIQEEITVFDVKEFKETYPKFSNYDFVDPADGEPIQLLIGNDYLFECLDFSSQILVTTGLYVLKSTLGWHIAGRMKKSKKSTATVMLATNKAIESLWNLEKIGITDNDHCKAKEEEIALAEFEQNIRYEEGRYAVTFPWKSYPPNIPTNYALAKGILLSLLKRYHNRTKYLEMCDAIFQQQLAEGIIEIAPQLHINAPAHYLPFHFIENPEKSTKLRIVYNGSAKASKQQLSLNDCLYKGTNLLTKIPKLILCARLKKILILADIKTAYHTLSLQEHERNFLRFLWVRNFTDLIEEQTIITYRFARVPFGIVTSSFLLAATIHHHLHKYNTTISKLLLENIYVDNLITAVNSLAEAYSLFQESTTIFNEAGMQLRQWNSNNAKFLQDIPPELQEENKTNLKVLGIRWNARTDEFQLTPPKHYDFERPDTLRRILKSVSQVFDPIGWATPVTIKAKALIQKLHEEKYEWDAVIDQKYTTQWKTIFKELEQLDTITIPRLISEHCSSSTTYSYHVFADASKTAYACAVYLRLQQNGYIATHLLYARARIAPLTELSIPRLELLAALIAIRALQYIKEALPLPLSTTSTVWLDSKCVLFWIYKGTNVPKFVKNRLTEIRQATGTIFRYVRSMQNSADLPSRGCKINELRHSKLWWEGPTWLSESESEWPTPWSPEDTTNTIMLVTQIYEQELPLTTCVTLTQTATYEEPFGINANTFSEYKNLIRITAYCIAFLQKTSFYKIKAKTFRFKNTPPVFQAHMCWIQSVQQHAFHNEFELLQQNKSNSLIQRLRLFIDELGILRAAGRLKNAPLSYYEKNPIVLPQPRNYSFVKLLIIASHTATMHAGTTHTLAHLRNTYWILSGRRNVYNIIRQCAACKKERARPFKQPTNSDLPKFRVSNQCHPFTYSGIDIAGHFWLQQSKYWILLATCLNIRAVALELLRDLSTPTIHNAFERISARRSAPTFVLSDNAKQFILLKTEIEQHRAEAFEWKFIKTLAPHEGGVYERLFKLVKTTLDRSLREKLIFTYDQLHTILYKIEAAMNDRPLTYLPNEPGILPLTPNHFLRTRLPATHTNQAPHPTTSEAAVTLRKMYLQQQQILQHFDSVWHQEYLQYLRERPAHQKFKSATTLRAPTIGDIVLVEENNVQRKYWKLAKILQLQRSADGEIRSAVVQLPSNTKIIRPLEKLYDLELNANQSLDS